MGSSFFYRKNKALYFLFALIASGLLSLSSCLKDPNFGNSPKYHTESIISALTVIHASPDAPTFDFVLNGEPIFPRDRAFSKTIPYFPLYARHYEARFYNHNTYSNAFYTTNIKLDIGKYMSLFLTGLKSDSLTSLLIEDNLTQPKTGKAKLRFLNLSPDAGALDFAIVKDSIFASHKKFKAYTAFYEIEAGEYSATFKSSEGDSVRYNFSLKLEKGKIYTVWAKGLIETMDEEKVFGNGLVVHDF